MADIKELLDGVVASLNERFTALEQQNTELRTEIGQYRDDTGTVLNGFAATIAAHELRLKALETVPEPEPPPVPTPPPNGKITPTYLGSWRVPRDKGFSFGGIASAVNQETGTLYVVGSAATNNSLYQHACELKIPEPVISDSLDDLPVAEFVQTWADPTHGGRAEMAQIAGVDSRTRVGGLLPWKGRLLWSVVPYYSNHRHPSHGFSSLDLSATDHTGPHWLDLSRSGIGAGWMVKAPAPWDTRLAPVIAGLSGIPQSADRASLGPPAVGFDPDALGDVAAPAEVYCGYFKDPPEARWDAGDANEAAASRGGAFIGDTLLIVGTERTGVIWYGGESTHLDGSPVTRPDGTPVSDPCSSNRGKHSEGRRIAFFFYDAHEYLKVKRGEKKPYEVRPYAISLREDHPKMLDPCAETASACYDATKGRLYVFQERVDAVGQLRYPLCHVYEVKR